MNQKRALEAKAIVIFVTADPKPHNNVVLAEPYRAVVVTDSNDADGVTAFVEP